MTGHRCVVQGCSNCADHASGISLHQCPVNRSEREKWMRFVRTRRANFNPTGRFVICSEHFSEDCFERSMHLDGSRRRILPGSVPTVRKKGLEKPLSARSRRNVSPCLLSPLHACWPFICGSKFIDLQKYSLPFHGNALFSFRCLETLIDLTTHRLLLRKRM